MKKSKKKSKKKHKKKSKESLETKSTSEDSDKESTKVPSPKTQENELVKTEKEEKNIPESPNKDVEDCGEALETNHCPEKQQ